MSYSGFRRSNAGELFGRSIVRIKQSVALLLEEVVVNDRRLPSFLVFFFHLLDFFRRHLALCALLV